MKKFFLMLSLFLFSNSYTSNQAEICQAEYNECMRATRLKKYCQYEFNTCIKCRRIASKKGYLNCVGQQFENMQEY